MDIYKLVPQGLSGTWGKGAVEGCSLLPSLLNLDLVTSVSATSCWCTRGRSYTKIQSEQSFGQVMSLAILIPATQNNSVASYTFKGKNMCISLHISKHMLQVHITLCIYVTIGFCLNVCVYIYTY